MSRASSTYAGHIAWTLDRLADLIGDLTADQLDWRPAIPDANSPAAIVAHVAGATRAYVLAFGCGLPAERDRDAEFAATAPDGPAPLIDALRALRDETVAALNAIPDSRLDLVFQPPAELWGAGEPGLVSARHCIVEAIRHAGVHLGELRLTRSLMQG